MRELPRPARAVLRCGFLRVRAVKWIGRGLGIALLLFAGILLFTYEAPPPEEPPPVVRPAKTMVLESPATVAERRFTGRVQASMEVDLSFRVAGPLYEFRVKANEEVQKGDVLARIDPRDFESRLEAIRASLAEERARLTAMEVGARPEDIRILEAELAAAGSRFKESQLQYNREKNLVAKGASTQSRMDEAQAALDVARENRRVADEALKVGRAGARKEDIEAQKARIRGLVSSERYATDAVKDTDLIAPFSGRIARTYVENFQDVRAKQKILSLQDVSMVEIVADVPEQIVAVMNRTELAHIAVVFDFLEGREFEAKYSEAEIEADRKTQTFAVTVVMEAPKDVKILPGMSATLRVRAKDSGAARNEWYVPAAAVMADDSGASFCWRVDEDAQTVHPVPVKVGDMRDDRILVREGLKPGLRIVTAGVRLLEDGMRIRVLAPRVP